MAEFFFIMLPAGVILICFCCVAHLYYINSYRLFISIPSFFKAA
jgi:hypothetical protein